MRPDFLGTHLLLSIGMNGPEDIDTCTVVKVKNN